MADKMSDHAEHNIKFHSSSWSGCSDCGRWIDTRLTLTKSAA